MPSLAWNGTAVIKALMKKWSEESHIRSSYLSFNNFEEHDDIADLKFSSLQAAFGKTWHFTWITPVCLSRKESVYVLL